MRFFDYLHLAFKNFARQKARTILTIIAITVGSLSLILMVSLLLSVRASLMDTFKKMGAFNLVTVTRDPNSSNNQSLISGGNNDPGSDEGKKIDESTLRSVKNLSGVTDATLVLNVWLKTARLDGQDKKIWGNVMAYSPESRVFEMPLLAGRGLENGDMDKVVVGSRFAGTYGYASHPQDLIGQKVIFLYEGGGGSAPDWGGEPTKPPQNAGDEWYKEQQKKGIEISAEIIGVADNGSMDDSQNYVTLAWGKRLSTQVMWKNGGENCDKSKSGQNGSPDCTGQNTLTLQKDDSVANNGYGSLIAKVGDTDNIKSVAESITQMGYGVTTAENMVKEMNNAFKGIGIILGVIGGISLFVAAIGIINTMVMATYERIREIGVMRACGATRAAIRRLFTFEAGMLGFFGGVFGMILSLILGKIAKLLVDKYGANLGNIPVDRVGDFPWWLIISVIAFTTLIGLISGVGPAIKAARLNPEEALRYE